MSFWKDYSYVDAHYEDPVTHRLRRWERLRIVDVQRRIVARAQGGTCLASVQRYKDATSLRDQQQEKEAAVAAQTSPPKKNGHDVSESARLAREQEGDELPDRQSHYHGLYFDFDSDPDKLKVTHEVALAGSHEDAKTLVAWFVRTFPDLEEAHVQCWFSGRKGFHVMLRPEPFGIKPHHHLTYIIRQVALELAASLSLKTLDKSVYTISRLWRIANTVHPKSGLHKIELTASELRDLKPGQIMALAKGTRGVTEDPWPDSHVWEASRYKDLIPDPDAAAWYTERYQAYDAYRDLKKLAPRRSIVKPDGEDEYPVCMRDILGNGPKPGGPNRNRVILPLAGFFHDAKIDRREAQKTIEDWTRQHYGPDQPGHDRIQNARSVVEQAYRGQIKFSCRFIRSLAGTGENGRVACVGEDKCSWIGAPADQEPARVPEIHLSEASKGCYENTRVKTAIHVAAVAGSPFMLPVKGRITCVPDPEANMCQRCPNKLAEGCGRGKLEFTLGAEDRHVLDMVHVNDTQKKGAIRAKVGIPHECHRHDIEVLETSNIEELQLIPMVDYAHAYQIVDDEDDAVKKSARHVVRQGFYFGHGIEANKKYVIEATVFGHPKDQRACFLFDKIEAAQNDIDQFRMTEELRDKLRLFQPRPGQTVDSKLMEIHRDLTANVHRIGGRFDLSIGVDLCYHAVIGFKLAGDIVHKGWFELLVMGDSGVGKGGRPQDRILTPSGWTTYGTVQVGDAVVGSNGKPTQVEGVYHRGKLPMYRVRFRDGAETVVSGDHLWAVGNINWERDGHPWKIRSTEELKKAGLYWSASGEKCSPLGRIKYWIPTSAPVEFDATTRGPLNPWLLGALLGDGGFTDASPSFTKVEVDLVERVRANLPEGDSLVPWTREEVGLHWRINGMRTRALLRELDLYGLPSEEKFIPPAYLRGSMADRWELLRGLCDTDGSVIHGGKSVEYSTSSPRLADEFAFLVRSLGGSINQIERIPCYTYLGEQKEGLLSYRITIHMPKGTCPVSSEKHLAKWTGKDVRYLRTIEAIDPVGEDECICIKVAAEDGLYVADQFVVTHNTTLVERIMRHYGLGELIAGEDAKRTGLVYASVQMQGQWILRWGKIPQNDQRLLAIDEFGGIPGEEVAKMTQLRSEGRARGGGVNADYETWARTRLIILTNPRNNRGQLAEFNYGVQAVNDLFDEVQDLRRVDLAMIAEKDEVETGLLNRRWDQEDMPHQYTADLCRNLVLWAWSRQPHHVEWAPGVEDALLKWAERLGATYDCDIPLAYPADLKHKIARIAAATAARLFSTDAEAKKVVIQQQHVDFAAKFMDRCYRKSSMNYFEYARKYKQDNYFNAGKKEAIRRMLSSFDDESDSIISTLLDVEWLNKSAFADMVSLEPEELKKLWKFLNKERLLRKTARGYKKTLAFTKFLKEMGNKASGYSHGDLPDDFETGGDFEAAKREPPADGFLDEGPAGDVGVGEKPPF